MTDLLFAPFQLPFMARALTVMLVLAVAAGLLGAFANLRRLEFLSDGLVHAVFPGVVIGFAIAGSGGLLVGGTIAAVVAAVVLTLVSRRGVPDDAAVAVVLTSMFSIGVIIVSRQSDYVGQLSELLFGRILTLTDADVAATATLAGVAVLLVLLTAKEQFLRAFDRQGAEAAGYRLLALDLVLNVAIALVVVAASRALGTLLMLALLIIPAAIGRLASSRFAVTVFVGIVSIALAGWLGLAHSFDASVRAGVSLPGSATVVLTLLALFIIALALFGLRRATLRLRRRKDAAPRAAVLAGGEAR
ncbi:MULTISPECIES: metal ABC transporter permease [unclassified Diaminobutyricimonas]|uniref:metal ABC transporter permease n=1 Tax=unclassified Diaminobutyricimonas TaxID=2643261 RepID=UPI001E579895|nr:MULTISPECIES: metal ABC transporter permease [unclassified Diaminobutyricimonas]